LYKRSCLKSIYFRYIFLCALRAYLCDPLWFNDLSLTTKNAKCLAKGHKGILRQPRNSIQFCSIFAANPIASLKAYFNSNSFFVWVIFPNFSLQKYVPLGSPFAVQTAWCTPSDLNSRTSVSTSLPDASNIVIVT